MSIRQEVLKRQYESRVAAGGAPAAGGCDRNGRPLPRVRRRWFWRYFWLLFLIALLCGFLHGRKEIADWFRGFADRGWMTSGKAEGCRLAAPSPGNSTIDAIVEYLTPSEAEMSQLYSYVANSPFVAENLQYRDRLKDLPFDYIADDDTVNAAAGRGTVEK
ncbi:MAG: hypothetical protein IIT98_03745, partial [Kiritimatiellae bacterium]|nr:hypothetical protein [Kiritimatiellia bacterium]